MPLTSRRTATPQGCSCFSNVNPIADYRQPEASSASVTLLDMLGRLPKNEGI